VTGRARSNDCCALGSGPRVIGEIRERSGQLSAISIVGAAPSRADDTGLSRIVPPASEGRLADYGNKAELLFFKIVLMAVHTRIPARPRPGFFCLGDF